MIYAIARKISTQECYNNEYKVVSLHDGRFSPASSHLMIDSNIIIETTNNIRIGDSINSNGDAWQSGG